MRLLHWASHHGAVGVVEALFETGVDVAERIKHGRTASEVAANSSILRTHREPLKPMRSKGRKINTTLAAVMRMLRG